jgi:hypothetical protein
MSISSKPAVSYTTIFGSDVVRDGFFAELCSCSDGVQVLIAEAFWSDVNQEFTVTFGEGPVPFSVLEEFVADARSRLPPVGTLRESNVFANGLPVPGA